MTPQSKHSGPSLNHQLTPQPRLPPLLLLLPCLLLLRLQHLCSSQMLVHSSFLLSSSETDSQFSKVELSQEKEAERKAEITAQIRLVNPPFPVPGHHSEFNVVRHWSNPTAYHHISPAALSIWATAIVRLLSSPHPPQFTNDYLFPPVPQNAWDQRTSTSTYLKVLPGTRSYPLRLRNRKSNQRCHLPSFVPPDLLSPLPCSSSFQLFSSYCSQLRPPHLNHL